MSQRSSRSQKKGRSRGSNVKKPELRTGPGRAAKAERARLREEAQTQSSDRGPAVRVRPSGPLGLIVLYACGVIGTALVVWGGNILDRWNILSWPDSLWLYVLIGAAAMAFPVAAMARSRRDVLPWVVAGGAVSLGMLISEQITAPGCPDGGQCNVIGARGSLGLIGSIVLIILLMAVVWYAAEAIRAASSNRRPRSGRSNIGILLLAILPPTLMFALPMALAGTGVDVLFRRAPQSLQKALTDVGQYCFEVDESVPDLSARPAPEGVDPSWSTWLVRRAHETRLQPGGKKLPNDWTNFSRPYPYEAIISFDQNGDRTAVTCGKISPRTGNATKADLTQKRLDLTDVMITPPSATPFRSAFLDNGPSAPAPAPETKPKKGKDAPKDKSAK